MTNDLGERRDLADERDSEEYQAMFEQVKFDLNKVALFWGHKSPDGARVHEETMRRLKEKYAQE